MTLWRHKKRGTVYEVITDHAHIQCASEPVIEDMVGNVEWTVYRDVKNWSIWVRRTAEFLDGRFERIEGPEITK